jgi:hypothetical protein
MKVVYRIRVTCAPSHTGGGCQRRGRNKKDRRNGSGGCPAMKMGEFFVYHPQE